MCDCPHHTISKLGIDSCTGDKIFVATNAKEVTNSDNKLFYKVYQGRDQQNRPMWSIDGTDSTQFEPVITPAKVNACYTADRTKCPFRLFLTNDPTVVKVRYNFYIMYFTDAAGIEINVMGVSIKLMRHSVYKCKLWPRFNIKCCQIWKCSHLLLFAGKT